MKEFSSIWNARLHVLINRKTILRKPTHSKKKIKYISCEDIGQEQQKEKKNKILSL
jgi:hypothetical protein